MTSKNHPLVQVIRLQVTSGHAEMTEGTKDSTSFILVHISKYHLYNTNCGKINIETKSIRGYPHFYCTDMETGLEQFGTCLEVTQN